MSRRNRTIAVVLMSLTMASVAASAMYQVVQRLPVREVEVANYHVVVAAKPLTMGTRLSDHDLKVVAWPSRNPVAGSHRIRRRSSLADSWTRSPKTSR